MKPRTDEQIRRDVLMRANWREPEIDRYLAAYPKPGTTAEAVAIFAERVRDLGRAIWDALPSRLTGSRP